MKKKKPVNLPFFLITWIIFSIASILLSYWLVGALTPRDGLSYRLRLLAILQDPFNDYFNDYSPVVMVMSFLFVEILFGLRYISSISATAKTVEKTDNEEEKKKNNSRKKRKTGEDRVNTMDLFIDDYKEEDERSETELEPDKEKPRQKKDEITVEDLRNKKADEDQNVKKVKPDEEERELVMDSDVFMKLFNAGYDMDQINAMLEVTYYINDIDETKLQKMFDKSMSPDEIRGYIEAFFE